ncbi:MAG: BBP7 family outer membrane beta-barrel protein [Planctomycetia bacterium]|nr:BBP7 family outer membrane beta-barrel protein [Planctomycetia bacterium]
MRKGLLGTIAALAAGAGTAWGQPPHPAGPPVGVPSTGAPSTLAGEVFQGPVPGTGGYPPTPVIMPPINVGPPHDPLGLGPVGGFGPPPGPMYPMPGPYGAAQFQPAPPTPRTNQNLGYGTAPHWWVFGEYLLWFNKGQNIRYPLLTTSAPADAGILGAASTTILVGERDLGYNAFHGFRLGAGFFGDADRRIGFEMTGWLTERRSNTQFFGGLGNLSGIPTLARPFIDFSTGAPSTIVLSGPDFGPAQVLVGTNSQTWSVEPVGIWNLYRSEPGCRLACSIDFVAGYKYLQLKEELFISSFTAVNGQVTVPIFTVGPFGIITLTGAGSVPAQGTFGGINFLTPTFIDIRDRFRTTNMFNGGIIGLKAEARYGMITTSGFAKVAVGNMHERLEIFGGGAFFDPTGRSGSAIAPIFAGGGLVQPNGRGVGTAVGGVLANPANIGTFVQDRFSVIPEFGANVGIALTKGLTGYIGAQFLFIPNVIRPGSQASPIVNSAAIPFSSNYGAAGATRGPRIIFDQDDYWLGGVNFGLQLRY